MCIYLCLVLPPDKESVAAREQLEKDLHSTRIQLQEWDRGDGAGGESTSDSHTERINSETEVSTLNHQSLYVQRSPKQNHNFFLSSSEKDVPDVLPKHRQAQVSAVGHAEHEC